ncbi:MAG TPA: gliding motility-associated C-terminal domain-containing protein [Flavobacteriales bacterium]|nr:gliding motility-associated C-terminal domain-containing protein [Flavobacteriales bacterium]
MTLRTSVFLLIAHAGELLAQNTSDCEGAIVLCGGIYTEIAAPPGTGNVYEFTGACNANLETASLWYTFTVQDPGDLSFVLDPANDADDYDWGLFNVTNGGCAGINAQDGTSPEVNCNSYGSLVGGNGATGISTANGGTGTSNGPGDLNGPAFNANLPVEVGQTYALVVMNWSGSPDGYTIDFTQSTASIYQDTHPVPLSVVPDCAQQNYYIVFSEQMVTASVEPEDFTLTSPSGETYAFLGVTPDNPSLYAQTGFTIQLDGALQEGGAYTLNITSVSENVEDVCGNIVVDTTFELVLEAPLTFDLTITTACNGDNGSVQVDNVTGGAEPIVFTLSNNPMPNGLADDLGPGTYLMSITDATGCNVLRQVEVPDHLIAVEVPDVQDSLSCSTTEVTIQGTGVSPEQMVTYAWSMIGPDGTPVPISTSAAPTVNSAGLYLVTVTEPVSGCTDDASVVISATSAPSVDLSLLTFPNVVSPNGDGKNDTWRPYLPQDPTFDVTPFFDEYELTILNRWGQLVHDGDGGRSWTARDVAAGTYFYRVNVQASCGTSFNKESSGTITVLR